MKLDKTLYSKAEYKRLKDLIIREKLKKKIQHNFQSNNSTKIAFIIGNGTSRKSVNLDHLKKIGTTYGCNALYRDFTPDFLIAVDVRMVLEITRTGYHNSNKVFTNPNRAFNKILNLNLFQPSKGWSSGPTALWLATQHHYKQIYILGFDYKGLDNGKKFNNVYANTPNYKKSSDTATFFGNWLRQTVTVIKETPNIQFTRVIQPDDFCPTELNEFNNFNTIHLKHFFEHFYFT